MQTVFHLESAAECLPLARSTWSDAMASKQRRDILKQAREQLVTIARKNLPDKFVGVEGIGQRPVLAIDATYQGESSHFYRVLPKEGGLDNQKGHMLLTYYDLRTGIPVDVKTETESMGEMRVLKAHANQGVLIEVVYAKPFIRWIGRLLMGVIGMRGSTLTAQRSLLV